MEVGCTGHRPETAPATPPPGAQGDVAPFCPVCSGPSERLLVDGPWTQERRPPLIRFRVARASSLRGSPLEWRDVDQWLPL